jgi:uncharacterized damage-inducible protein DinB
MNSGALGLDLRFFKTTLEETLMRKILFAAILCCLAATPALAQAAPPATPQAPPPLSTWLRNAYTSNRGFLAKAAEKMPEEFYGLRPGAQEEVRTFGKIIGHVANANFNYCSRAKGEKNPNAADFEKLTTKAELVKALNDAFTYCDAVYGELTDASATETVQVTLANGRQVQFVRITQLIGNHAHNNEHYGNLVTYMRMKSIVPPSSEPRTP